MQTVAIGLAWVSRQLGPSPADKVVFIRGDALVVANGDGTNQRELVNDGQAKSHPAWSPDGRRIAFEVPGSVARDPKTHAVLIVVDGDGNRVAAIPVLSTLPDGSEVAGMRFVDRAGWHSAAALFVEGSANPYVAEYRVLDVDGRRSPDYTGSQFYLGSQFAACASRGEVAYAGDSREQNAFLAVNDQRTYDVTSAGVRIRTVAWSSDCSRLMFLEVGIEEPFAATLVVLRGSSVEARLPLPAELGTVVTARPFLDGFVIAAGTTRAVVYEVETRTLQASTAARQLLTDRAAVVERLGGHDPDWWTAASAAR